MPLPFERHTYTVNVSDNDVNILVNVPGCTAEDIQVLEDEGRIQVLGRGDHLVSFRLPKDIDREGITARVENGQLQISMPVAKRPEPRAIPVESSGITISASTQQPRLGTKASKAAGSTNGKVQKALDESN